MRILIAEDEVEIACALKVLLEKNKCTADIVHNGKDAWDYICQSKSTGKKKHKLCGNPLVRGKYYIGL